MSIRGSAGELSKGSGSFLRLDALRRVEALGEEEAKLLKGILSGASRSGLARDLDLTIDSLQLLTQSLFGKLGAKCNADAVRIAIYAGWD